MKEITVKCPKCGKDYVVNRHIFTDTIECHHCHFKHEIDSKTRKRLKFWGYGVSIILMFICCFIISLFGELIDSKIMIVVVIILGFILVPFSDKLAKPFVFLVFGANYIPLEKKKK